MKLSHTIHSQHKIHWCVILDKQYGMCSISFFLKKTMNTLTKSKMCAYFVHVAFFPIWTICPNRLKSLPRYLFGLEVKPTKRSENM